MTTIAFDGKTLAADTNWESAYRQQHDTSKIERHGGVAWGAAGQASDCVLFDRWMKAGRPEDQKPPLDDHGCFSALVIQDGKSQRCEGKSLVFLPAGIPAATGSGCAEAMGAMMAGATAKRAVEIAIKLDSGTGGKVRTLNCAAKKK